MTIQDLIPGAIYRFEMLPDRLWQFSGVVRQRGCQMHGDDVKSYGVFRKVRNSPIRPLGNLAELDADLAIFVRAALSPADDEVKA